MRFHLLIGLFRFSSSFATVVKWGKGVIFPYPKEIGEMLCIFFSFNEGDHYYCQAGQRNKLVDPKAASDGSRDKELIAPFRDNSKSPLSTLESPPRLPKLRGSQNTRLIRSINYFHIGHKYGTQFLCPAFDYSGPSAPLYRLLDRKAQVTHRSQV